MEDVSKKFIALKEAEARDWKDLEVRPEARKRVVKVRLSAVYINIVIFINLNKYL